jgi:hypothetical protein
MNVTLASTALAMVIFFTSKTAGAEDVGNAVKLYSFGEVPIGGCTILGPQAEFLELPDGDPRAKRPYGAILGEQVQRIRAAAAADGGNALLMVNQYEAIGLDGVQTYSTKAYGLRCIDVSK